MASLDELLAELACGDESRAEAAAGQLAKRGEAALPGLRSLFASPDPEQRWWAVRALAGIPGVEVAVFDATLADPSAEVRQAGVLALLQHPRPAALPALIPALADPDPLVASLAGKALAAIGKPAVPDLIEIVRDAPQPARIHALQALAEIRDPRAIPAMMKVMEEGSAALQYWAEEGLNRLGLNMVYIKPG